VLPLEVVLPVLPDVVPLPVVPVLDVPEDDPVELDPPAIVPVMRT